MVRKLLERSVGQTTPPGCPVCGIVLTTKYGWHSCIRPTRSSHVKSVVPRPGEVSGRQPRREGAQQRPEDRDESSPQRGDPS